MLALITDGVAPQQAARLVVSGAAPPVVSRADDTSPGDDLALLGAALERFDDVAANAVFDALLGRYTVRTVLVLRRCSLPCRPRRPVGAR